MQSQYQIWVARNSKKKNLYDVSVNFSINNHERIRQGWIAAIIYYLDPTHKCLIVFKRLDQKQNIALKICHR